jgi:hypothetical protein
MIVWVVAIKCGARREAFGEAGVEIVGTIFGFQPVVQKS